MENLTITSDGTYIMDSGYGGGSGSRIIIYVSGELGGATATLMYANGKDHLVPLEDGVVEPNKQYFVEPGIGMKLKLYVSGATPTTDLDVIICGLS